MRSLTRELQLSMPLASLTWEGAVLHCTATLNPEHRTQAPVARLAVVRCPTLTVAAVAAADAAAVLTPVRHIHLAAQLHSYRVMVSA